MKYANQINLLLAVIGFGIVIYVASQTVFSSNPAPPVDIEALQRLSEARAERYAATLPPPTALPMMQGSATTRQTPVEVLRGASGVVMPSAPPARPGEGPTNRRPLQVQRPPTRTLSVGERPGGYSAADDGSGYAPAAPSSPDDPGFQPTSRQRPRALPPQAEGEKRPVQPNAPPYRSSMPARRP